MSLAARTAHGTKSKTHAPEAPQHVRPAAALQRLPFGEKYCNTLSVIIEKHQDDPEQLWGMSLRATRILAREPLIQLLLDKPAGSHLIAISPPVRRRKNEVLPIFRREAPESWALPLMRCRSTILLAAEPVSASHLSLAFKYSRRLQDSDHEEDSVLAQEMSALSTFWPEHLVEPETQYPISMALQPSEAVRILLIDVRRHMRKNSDESFATAEEKLCSALALLVGCDSLDPEMLSPMVCEVLDEQHEEMEAAKLASAASQDGKRRLSHALVDDFLFLGTLADTLMTAAQLAELRGQVARARALLKVMALPRAQPCSFRPFARLLVEQAMLISRTSVRSFNVIIEEEPLLQLIESDATSPKDKLRVLEVLLLGLIKERLPGKRAVAARERDRILTALKDVALDTFDRVAEVFDRGAEVGVGDSSDTTIVPHPVEAVDALGPMAESICTLFRLAGVDSLEDDARFHGVTALRTLFRRDTYKDTDASGPSPLVLPVLAEQRVAKHVRAHRLRTALNGLAGNDSSEADTDQFYLAHDLAVELALLGTREALVEASYILLESSEEILHPVRAPPQWYTLASMLLAEGCVSIIRGAPERSLLLSMDSRIDPDCEDRYLDPLASQVFAKLRPVLRVAEVLNHQRLASKSIIERGRLESAFLPKDKALHLRLPSVCTESPAEVEAIGAVLASVGADVRSTTLSLTSEEMFTLVPQMLVQSRAVASARRTVELALASFGKLAPISRKLAGAIRTMAPIDASVLELSHCFFEVEKAEDGERRAATCLRLKKELPPAVIVRLLQKASMLSQLKKDLPGTGKSEESKTSLAFEACRLCWDLQDAGHQLLSPMLLSSQLVDKVVGLMIADISEGTGFKQMVSQHIILTLGCLAAIGQKMMRLVDQHRCSKHACQEAIALRTMDELLASEGASNQKAADDRSNQPTEEPAATMGAAKVASPSTTSSTIPVRTWKMWSLLAQGIARRDAMTSSLGRVVQWEPRQKLVELEGEGGWKEVTKRTATRRPQSQSPRQATVFPRSPPRAPEALPSRHHASLDRKSVNSTSSRTPATTERTRCRGAQNGAAEPSDSSRDAAVTAASESSPYQPRSLSLAPRALFCAATPPQLPTLAPAITETIGSTEKATSPPLPPQPATLTGFDFKLLSASAGATSPGAFGDATVPVVASSSNVCVPPPQHTTCLLKARKSTSRSKRLRSNGSSYPCGPMQSEPSARSTPFPDLRHLCFTPNLMGPTTTVPVASVDDKIKWQVGYWFSQENLEKDWFLAERLGETGTRAVPVELIARFRLLASLQVGLDRIVRVMRQMEQLVVSHDGTLVARRFPYAPGDTTSAC
jgi:hypothetical protein